MKCILDRDEYWPAYGLFEVKDEMSGRGEGVCEISEEFMKRYKKAVKEFNAVNEILGEMWDNMKVED